MRLPQVAIVGRPNVGKSSIFNWLAGRRLAIVDNVAGVTRDRNTHIIEHDDVPFEIVDTGGVGINDIDDLTTEIDQQIQVAIDRADVILFVVDTREGLMPLDEEVARRLRQINKPIIFAANKTDSDTLDNLADEFYRLGMEDILLVSTLQNRNKNRLLAELLKKLPERDAVDPLAVEEPEMKVALVGRRNVGKSTFINTLTQEDRMIVSEVAGTTRDSVDVRYELDGHAFLAIDTPGLRKNKSMRTDIEYYSTHRAKRSIRRSDVTLMFFDAGQRVSKVDKQLCKYIEDENRPCIFVVNKWDLMQGELPTERWSDYLRDTFRTMWHVPIAFITGQTGKNCKMLLNHAQMLYKQSRTRIATGELNRLVQMAMERHPPPLSRFKRPKVFYVTQTAIQPPTIVIVCNHPEAFPLSYRRYILSVMRDQLSFGEVPIRVIWRKRPRNEKSRGERVGGAGAFDKPEEALEYQLGDGTMSDGTGGDDAAFDDVDFDGDQFGSIPFDDAPFEDDAR